MSDVPSAVPAPVAPVVNNPALPVAPATPVAKAPDAVAKPAGEAPKGDTPAEKEVIRKIKLGDTEYDEKVLTAMIEKAKGADKKFLEAAEMKKTNMRFLKLAKENPKEFLIKTGLDPKKFAYDEVAQDLKDKLRDPKEVELEAAQKRLKAYEEKEAAEKKTREESKLAQEAKAFEAKFHKEMIEALDSAPTLPKNGFTVARIAKYIDTVHNKTGVLLSAKEVVSVIEQDIRSEMAGITKGASVKQLLALVGEEGLAALRKYDLEQLKDPLKNGGNPQDNAPSDGERIKPRKYKSSHNFWRSVDDDAKKAAGGQ